MTRTVEPSEPRARILLVEDDPGVARVLQRILRRYDVVYTASSRDALGRILGGERYDVIVSDLMLPEMTGAELYSELDKTAPEQAARMIFVTGGATDEAAQDFLDSAPRPVIDKPIQAARLQAEVQKVIDG